jgi:L-fuconolactonase
VAAIDAHVQIWNLDEVVYAWLTKEYGVLNRTYETTELEPQLRGAGVRKAVLVQSANSYEETAYLLRTSDQTDWIGAVIGWVDLLNPRETGERLTMYQRHPRFRGIRHLIHYETDPNWIMRRPIIDSLRVASEHQVVFELAAQFPDHLKHVPDLAAACPDLKIVVDHLARPPIRTRQMSPWSDQLRAAAEMPNVYAKISGLNTSAEWQTWTSADLKPYVDFAIDVFGADRLMYGSDWPTCLLAGTYAQVWVAASKALEGRPNKEISAILGGTATRLYGIH